MLMAPWSDVSNAFLSLTFLIWQCVSAVPIYVMNLYGCSHSTPGNRSFTSLGQRGRFRTDGTIHMFTLVFSHPLSLKWSQTLFVKWSILGQDCLKSQSSTQCGVISSRAQPDLSINLHFQQAPSDFSMKLHLSASTGWSQPFCDPNIKLQSFLNSIMTLFQKPLALFNKG